ncbi:hypothetical protein [Mycolicibacterium fluoranthenivorans]|uniref:Uncharacterized protein n=1 Tax=Mycolicibacterium fluoranthenivorans TaxID=258505 RepID=A0A1G4X2S4_9MYCO|nr:hypothetical protein [Mycolicibacterium fluoranthenivorans]SCX34512.1 hypothetical protein SAMN02799620_06361 [Mycolicibacterium fluoranthenivorans]
MKASTLTDDQRWLLWTVGLNISRALIDDAGLQHFMASMNGYYGTARDGAPEWMSSYQTMSGKITSPARGGDHARVAVTSAHIRAFRKTIPAELLAELAAIDKGQMDEHWRTEMWCWCHRSRGEVVAHTDFLGREKYHPSDSEDDLHLEIVWDLQDRERDCLRTILGVGAEKLGQLELFEVSA